MREKEVREKEKRRRYGKTKRRTEKLCHNHIHPTSHKWSLSLLAIVPHSTKGLQLALMRLGRTHEGKQKKYLMHRDTHSPRTKELSLTVVLLVLQHLIFLRIQNLRTIEKIGL